MVNSIPVNETFSLTLKKQKKKGKKSINKKRATGSVSPAGPASWFFLFGNQIVFAVWGFFFFVTLSGDVLLFCFFCLPFFRFCAASGRLASTAGRATALGRGAPLWRHGVCRDVATPVVTSRRPFHFRDVARFRASSFCVTLHLIRLFPFPVLRFFFFPSFFFQIFGSQLLLTGCNLLRLVPDISS